MASSLVFFWEALMFFQEFLKLTVKWRGCVTKRISAFPPTQGFGVLPGRMRLTFLLCCSPLRDPDWVSYIVTCGTENNKSTGDRNPSLLVENNDVKY